MKSLRLLIMGLCLLPYYIYGQCTGCDIVVSTNSAVNYNLVNQKLCITGGEYSGQVVLGENASLCIGPGAIFRGVLLTNGPNAEIQNFGTIITNLLTLTGSTFTGTGTMNFNSVIINNGAVFETTGGRLSMNGLTVNSGGVLRSNSITAVFGPVNNFSNSEISFFLPFYVQGTIFNLGTIELWDTGVIDGSLTNQQGGLMTLCSYMFVEGSYGNFGETQAATPETCGGIFAEQGDAANEVGAIYGTIGFLDICPGFNTQNGTVGGNVTYCNPCLSQCGAILPVTFLGLEASFYDEKVHVNWSTISEKNANEFIILVADESLIFTPIASKKAVGESEKYLAYTKSFSPFHNVNEMYVKIREIDNDGSMTETEIVKVKVFEKDLVDRIKVFPNPFFSDLSINLPEGVGQVSITIKNIQGAVLHKAILKEIQAELELNWLDVGTYIIEIESDKGKTVRKIVKN